MSKEKQQYALVRRVLLDLEISKKYHDAHICYDDLQHIYYLKAECSNKETYIILPHLSCQDMDLRTVNELHGRVGGSRFLIALCDNSSNILYYHQMQGVFDV